MSLGIAQEPTTPPPPIDTTYTTKKIEINDDVEAPVTHQIVRRLALFPLAIDEYKKEADAAWWGIREFFANSQRFLVATKRLMSQKDVFQPRKAIVPTDVILLAKVLDADCIISTFVNKNSLKMIAYDGDDGFPLWEKSLPFNASLPVEKQVESLSMKLAKDFIASLPYQGFQIVDPLIGKPVYEEGDVNLAKVDIGAKAQAQVGEQVQWITIERQSSAPLFQGGGLVRVLAEGEIIKTENQTVLVEIKRVNDVKQLIEKSLVSIPSESARLHTLYAIEEPGRPKISTLMLAQPMHPTETKSSQARPLLTSLASVAGLVALILLAF